ncbi:hypothetical protein BN3589_02095 [Clostridium sp. C105KSO14]|nr:hypothetical protein BN3589_02095 [Clostridium sp. C105KSO14]
MILATRIPAANVKMPPQADRSANIPSVIHAPAMRPTPKITSRTRICGPAITQTALPSAAANTRAVKKSRTDLENNRLVSPAIPSINVLYQPNPEQQNNATTTALLKYQ